MLYFCFVYFVYFCFIMYNSHFTNHAMFLFHFNQSSVSKAEICMHKTHYCIIYVLYKYQVDYCIIYVLYKYQVEQIHLTWSFHLLTTLE